MENNIEKDSGEQPLYKIMFENHLSPRDLVNASEEQLTFKMVGKAIKGRRLTPNIQFKVLNAVNKVLQKSYSKKDLFNY